SRKEFLGIGDATLPSAQLPKPSKRITNHRRTRGLQSVHRGIELGLGLGPLPLPTQNAGVVSSAGVQKKDVVLSAKVADPRAPLRGPLVVANTLTGRDHVTTGPGDAIEETGFALKRDGCRFVESAHALLELAVAHQGPPLET